MTNIKFTSENLTCEGQTSSNITVDRGPDSRFRGTGSNPSLVHQYFTHPITMLHLVPITNPWN